MKADPFSYVLSSRSEVLLHQCMDVKPPCPVQSNDIRRFVGSHTRYGPMPSAKRFRNDVVDSVNDALSGIFYPSLLPVGLDRVVC